MNRSGKGKTRYGSGQTIFGCVRPRFESKKDWVRLDANDNFICEPRHNLTLVLTASIASTSTLLLPDADGGFHFDVSLDVDVRCQMGLWLL